MNYKKSLVIIASFLLIVTFLTPVGSRKKRSKAALPTESKDMIAQDMPARYKVKEFSIVMEPGKGLSNKQIDQHKQLYVGYVGKRNEIDQKLQTVDRAGSNATYSPFRALKTSETFARNASLLHEMYFENLATGHEVGPSTLKAIIQNFGSFDFFKEDVMASCIAARGWVLTCYNLDDGRIQNYVLDSHNNTVPVMTIPLLVIDVYEHAYMIDYGINRKEYLATIWENINWAVVEERVAKWMSLFLQ